MKINEIAVPEVYTQESADFRTFLKWFEESLTKIQYDIEHGSYGGVYGSLGRYCRL